MEKPKRKFPARWVIVGVAVLAGVGLLAGAPVLIRSGLLPGGFLGRNSTGNASALTTGEVIRITAVSSVESSGSVEAQQLASVFWETTGQVASVLITPGRQVKKGDLLMTIDPDTAPQTVIQAQSELINAQKALDELLNPTTLSIANARQAVANAEQQLEKAQRDLRYAQNPASQSLFNAVEDAELALETAQADAQLATVSADAQAYNQAVASANIAFSVYQNLQAKWDAGDHSDFLQRALESAHAAYQSALDNQLALELRINTDVANKEAAVADAQQSYDQAAANLDAALRGPDAIRLAVAQANVAVAEASLADAQDQLNRLLNGADPDDITVAQVQVQVAQATLDTLALRAPFDGEILVVTYQPGDSVSQSQPAVVIANRAQVHVNASIDESEVSQVAVGDEVSLTFDSLPDLTLAGSVGWISAVGETVQGLVRYTVRVDAAQTDPRVLLGMTANVKIVTDVQEGVLAVPLDAVQLDDQGEYVNRVNALGVVERVNVVSGEVQDDLVIVTGDLLPGDRVQLIEPQPTNTVSPFGPG